MKAGTIGVSIQQRKNHIRKGRTMGEVIAIVSRKGGTGKSTTAQAIADGIRRAGYSVLLIDLDSQHNLTAAMGADPNGLNSTDLFDINIRPAKLIQNTPNGDIIAGSDDLAAGDAVLTDNGQLKKALKPFIKNYDYIIIDTPASYGRLTMNALTAATQAIITTEPATFSADGLTALAKIIKQIRRNNKNLSIRGIIVTRCDSRSNEVKQTIEEIRAEAAAIGTEVLEPPIRATAKVSSAQRHRQNLFDYAPRSTAADDYKQIISVLLKE